MPMSEERSQLRLSIVPQLLEVVKYNNARQMDSVALYEIGSVFLKQDNETARRARAYCWCDYRSMGSKSLAR